MFSSHPYVPVHFIPLGMGFTYTAPGIIVVKSGNAEDLCISVSKNIFLLILESKEYHSWFLV